MSNNTNSKAGQNYSKSYSVKESNHIDSQPTPQEAAELMSKGEFHMKDRILDLSQNSLQNRGVWELLKGQTTWNSLKILNLAGNDLGKVGAKILCCDATFKALKHLELSKNYIVNEGIKHIAEGSSWTDLRVLILNDVCLDYHGAKFLSTNEHWKNLQELHLQDNPLVGDLGAIELSHNKGWKHLQKLMLDNSNVGESGIQFLKRNKAWKDCLFQGCGSERSLKQHLVFESSWKKKTDWRGNSPNKQLKTEFSSDSQAKKSITPLTTSSRTGTCLSYEYQSRGGGNMTRGKPGEIENEHINGLWEKVKNYIQRVRNTMSSEDETKIYIEPLGWNSSSPSDSDSDIFELATETTKRLLDHESDLKVLLLSGEFGVGKTLFCKYLQRLILPEHDALLREPDESVWIPILIDLSRRKDPKSSQLSTITISEILRQELLLTESEITLLQENDSNKSIPHFLFIFDEYRHIQTPNNVADCIRNNFCASVGFEPYWKNAKMIATCQSEIISSVPRKDILFGPLTPTKTLIPNSFAEFVFLTFTDDQLSSYLRKYFMLEHPADFYQYEGTLIPETEPWDWVACVENIIDSYSLRELVRTPLFLSMLFEAYYQRTEEKSTIKESAPSNKKKRKKSHVQKGSWSFNENGLQNLNHYRLFEHFTDHLITRTIKNRPPSIVSQKDNEAEDDDTLSQKLKKQLQNLALSLSKFPLALIDQEPKMLEKEQKEIDVLLLGCPLLNLESSNDVNAATFVHKSFGDFLIASKIEEEIRRFELSGSADPSTMILNQRLLFTGSDSITVFQFLVDAVVQIIIPTSSLIKLIQLSKIKGAADAPLQSDEEMEEPMESEELILNEKHSSPHENDQHENISQRQNRFSIAAANAMTILNAAGYGFSMHALDNVCIAGADLNHGYFEGTNFTGSDLTGINFSGAWLKDTKFMKANMSAVQLGLVPDIPLQHEASFIAHSPTGSHMIAVSRGEIIIFEKHPGPKPYYKEKGKLKGHIGDTKRCSFSKDGEYLISGHDDGYLHVWNVKSGECVQTLRGHDGPVLGCEFGQDRSQIVSADDRKIKIWGTSGNRWSPSREVDIPKGATSCGFVPNANRMIYLRRNTARGLLLYNSVTGRYLQKYEDKTEAFAPNTGNFSSEGKQYVTEKLSGNMDIVDCIRGHLIKTMIKTGFGRSASFSLFSPCGTQLISRRLNALRTQSVADGWPTSKPLDTEILGFSLDPDEHGQIGLLLKDKRVIHEEIEVLKNPWKVIPTKGSTNKGLNLVGSNIDDALGLSEENITIFCQKGDYSGFGEEKFKVLILNDRTSDLEKITHIKLNVGGRGALVIGRNSKWPNLQRLDLSGNNLSDKDAVKVGHNATWKNLQELILNSNQLAERTAAAIAENPCLKNLRILQLASNKLRDAGAKALSKNSRWKDLEELNLSQNQIGDEGATGLGKDNCWKNLKKLDLSSNNVGDKGASAIANNQTWSSLEELRLGTNQIEDNGAVAIGGNTIWTKLRILSLEINQISDTGATAIATNSSWINLEELYVFNNDISPKFINDYGKISAWSKIQVIIWSVENPGIRELFKASNIVNKNVIDKPYRGVRDLDAIAIAKGITWPQLEKLILGGNYIGDQGAAAIGKSTAWPNLKLLSMPRNNIRDEGAMAIGSNTTWTNLEKLELYENEIGDKGIVAIGNSTNWSKLKELGLKGNKIGAEGARALGLNKAWNDLEKLDLEENEIGDEGAIGIAENINWTRLQTLDLRKNNIGDKGAMAIGSNTIWVNLTELHLGENNIGDKGASAIGNNQLWSMLSKLDLNTNKIGDVGMRSIGSNTTWTRLACLLLYNNQIRAEGVAEIGNNSAWIKLRRLTLSHNKIGDEGAISIASNSVWTELHTLELEEIEIGDRGAIALSNNSVWGGLISLCLNRNKISDEGAIAIASNPTWANLTELILGENQIGDKGAIAIGTKAKWSLKTLDLHGNKIGDEGASVIATATWDELEFLDLSDNEIGDKGAVSLAFNTTWEALTKLFLNGNKIGNEGILALGQNITWASLEEIRLHSNSFNDESSVQQAFDIEAWERLTPPVYFINPALKNLMATVKNRTITHVCLSSQGLRDDDMDILVNSLPTSVETLELSHNNIGDGGAAFLGRDCVLFNLKKLDLSHNCIGTLGAIEGLALNRACTRLQELNLSYNQIEDECIASILRNATFRKLSNINLSSNKLSDEAAIDIGRHVGWVHLEEMYLNENEISDRGAIAIGRNIVWKKLKKLEICENTKITQKGKEELKKNPIFGSFVRV